MSDTIVSFDLTPDQMEILSPVMALAEICANYDKPGVITAVISPTGIADVTFHAPVVLVFQQIKNEPVRCTFGDGTRVSLTDVLKGEIQNAQKIAA